MYEIPSVRSTSAYLDFCFTNGRQDAIGGRESAASLMSVVGSAAEVEAYSKGFADGVVTLLALNRVIGQ